MKCPNCPHDAKDHSPFGCHSKGCPCMTTSETLLVSLEAQLAEAVELIKNFESYHATDIDALPETIAARLFLAGMNHD